MKNCLIMGFGRSGTSLMGGILHKAGYYMGKNLYPPRESNPLGFFENDFINGINEHILEQYDYASLHQEYPLFNKPWSSYKPAYGQRWLTYIPAETVVNYTDHSIINRINKALTFPVYAYKDPRFNYTLPVWNQYLGQDVMFICMFREPQTTVESVIKDCHSADYLKEFYVDREIVYEVWLNSYTHLLKNLDPEMMQRTIFVHYRQLLNRKALGTISEKLQAGLDDSFISDALNRSRGSGTVPEKVDEMYKRLCALADYHDII
jgi:hypothetical protein